MEAETNRWKNTGRNIWKNRAETERKSKKEVEKVEIGETASKDQTEGPTGQPCL